MLVGVRLAIAQYERLSILNYLWLYFIVLLAYSPGLVLLVYSNKIWKFPILNFAFIGMFAFNALGSIGVFDEEKIYTIEFDSHSVSEDLVLLLVLQVILYYLLVVPYLMIRIRPIVPLSVSRYDGIGIGIGLSAILIIGSLYYHQTGTFLLLASLDGSMNVDNAYQFRDRLIYGLSNWPFYNLGFVFLPVFVSSYAFIRAKVKGRADLFFYVAILICFCASLSMGSKAGLINFVLSLAIAYGVYLGANGESLIKLIVNKSFLIFVLFSMMLMIVGYLNATPEQLTMGMLSERLWYRAFVTYPETMAAAISYTREIDFLGVTMFPTVRGLLSHEYSNLPLLLHVYIAGVPGGMNVPFAGEAFISAGWLGVMLACPVIFGTLIALQEIAFRLTSGVASLAFSSFYAYMAILLSINGMFATLFTFMYPITLLALAATTLLIDWAFLKLSHHAQTLSNDQPKS